MKKWLYFHDLKNYEYVFPFNVDLTLRLKDVHL